MWLYAVCTVHALSAVCVCLCACVVLLCVFWVHVCVGWWFRAAYGPSRCSAPWGYQGGPRAASAPERPQMGSEACGRGDRGACEGLWGKHGESWRYSGGYEAHGRLGDPVGAMGHLGKQCDTQRVRILEERFGSTSRGLWGPGGAMEHPGRGSLWGTEEVRGTPGGLRDTQEVGKTRGFMRHTGRPSPPRTGLGAPKGAQGHPGKGRIAGFPQKLMPEPRTVAPPLLQAPDGAPRGRKNPSPPDVKPHWRGA